MQLSQDYTKIYIISTTRVPDNVSYRLSTSSKVLHQVCDTAHVDLDKRTTVTLNPLKW